MKSASSQGVWTRASYSALPYPCQPAASHRLGLHPLPTDSLPVRYTLGQMTQLCHLPVGCRRGTYTGS